MDQTNLIFGDQENASETIYYLTLLQKILNIVLDDQDVILIKKLYCISQRESKLKQLLGNNVNKEMSTAEIFQVSMLDYPQLRRDILQNIRNSRIWNKNQ